MLDVSIRVAVLEPDLLGLPGLRAFLARADSPEMTDLEVLDPGGPLRGLDVAIGSFSAQALSALRRRGARGEPPALLLLAGERDDLLYVPPLELRAVGVLPEGAGEDEIAAAVRALAEGLAVGPADLLAPLLSRWGGGEPAGPAESPLTAREIEVLQGLAAGRANKQIAGDLAISEHTVKFYTSAIYGKLGVTNRAEAVAVGIRLGLLHV